jgi:hypothetical protein
MGIIPNPHNPVKDKFGFILYVVVIPGLIIAILALGATDHYRLSNRYDNLAKQGAEAHSAICTFRADLQRRVDETRTFLKEHPSGFEQLGLTASALRVTLINQEKTVRTLDVLQCPKEETQ